jgi:nitrite reductase (NADH) large subunit
VDVASFGDAKARTPGALKVVVNDPVRRSYGKLVISDDAKTLLGGILVGDASQYAMLRAMVGAPLSEDPSALITGANIRSGEKGLGVRALPGAAQICSCNAVTKGRLLEAITGGEASDVPGLKACTRAGTGCGSCVPTLKQLLESAGVEQSKALCEHFAASRAELFEIIAGAGIRTFTEAIERHGRGRGCDICKPVVASILAACWNEFVLKPKHAPLQDTNDHFLANLQKDGTYSIVPRVPGGEILPEKLIVLGEVAKKYGLYTKITGAQRIDLFGARVEQLPLIWRELVDAGFESGHAYGKALRTVKSCVGSTWCRFGVQDSVLMAVDLENRYRGLRAPHKLKMAVSGCTRECAEAQGKDVGIIATEKGWNLYVCGNGGVKPRHADLLAKDLDDKTLVQYIDRFLMFYIRTGDRLQRTASWLDNLEGGIDYVRQVVCEDSLGLGAELEADMQKLVNNYECEWKKAINDPETLKRFRHFVNSEESDRDVVFVAQRGQIRPARPDERESALEAIGA